MQKTTFETRLAVSKAQLGDARAHSHTPRWRRACGHGRPWACWCEGCGISRAPADGPGKAGAGTVVMSVRHWEDYGSWYCS